MGLREISGYVAHVLLALYWLWTLTSSAPQLRKGLRDRGLRVRILLVKSAGIVLTALLVGVIHFWATALWQVGVAIPVAAALGYPLRRAYRRLVQAPRHRLTLVARVRRGRTGPVLAEPLPVVSGDVLRVVPLPTAPAPVAGEVELPAAEPAPAPAATADSALMGLSARVPAPRSTWEQAVLALPEPGEHVTVDGLGVEVDAVLVDRIRRQSQVVARGSLQPLRR
jgi:hypothetical protein